MQWLSEHFEAIGAICGALSGTWAVAMKADKAIRAHLREEFATKDDLSRIENKIDKVLLLAFQVGDYNRDDKLKLL